MPFRLLVVRLGSLGDLIHTLPAVSAIRRARPDAEIDWLVDDMHRELLDLVPVISSVVALDRPTMGGWLDARRRLRARRYDLALDFQGLLKSAALARLAGPRRTIGFDRASLREPAAAIFYSHRVAAADVAHVMAKNLRLAEAAGARPETPLEFPIAHVHSAVADDVRAAVGDEYVLLNGGAAWPNKRWPAERFGRLARWIRDTRGLASVALWGPGEEGLADTIVRASGGAAVRAPATGLADLVALARGARLVVSGDTGPTHIAAAVGTPVVAIFGPTDLARNGPWDPADVHVALDRYRQCDCHYERRCRRSADEWCLGTIGEDAVRAAVEARLAAAEAAEATC